MKRKVLGKGLRSLIPEAPPPTAVRRAVPKKGDGRNGGGELLAIDVDRIRPNPRQPRNHFHRAGLEALAKSLKTQGVMQPVVVRATGADTYELVAGERRWRAAQLAGLLTVPAVVREVPDDQLLQFALVENLQREELDPIDEAKAYQALLHEYGWGQQKVADQVGRKRATIANSLRLLALPPRVQELIRKGAISAGHGKAVASLSRAHDQVVLADRAAREQLSVRQTERAAARMERAAKDPTIGASKAARDPNLEAAERRLETALGTRVRIHPGKKGGRIELHFFSQEEMDHGYQLLLRAAKQKV